MNVTASQRTQNLEPERDTQTVDTLYCFCDLDLDPMTLIYGHGLDILKMYLSTKSELCSPRLSKVRAFQTDRQTDRQTDTDATENTTTPHSRVLVIIYSSQQLVTL